MPLVLTDCYNSYRLIGIDPGLNHVGIAIFDIETATGYIRSIEAYTEHIDKLYDDTGLNVDILSNRTIKLYKLRGLIGRLLQRVGACVVACESPFYNPRMPMAFGALVEVMLTIHSAIIDYNQNIPFIKIPPLVVKSVVGAGATKGKLDVKACIKGIDEIVSVLRCDIEALDEHSIDSIGVGYSFLRNLGG